jgi:hypothetical protein
MRVRSGDRMSGRELRAEDEQESDAGDDADLAETVTHRQLSFR